MKSAREIACTDKMGDCGGVMFPEGGHSEECDTRTEAIQQAREDGASWMLTQVRQQAAVKTTQMVTVEEIDFGYFDPRHIRGVAPMTTPKCRRCGGPHDVNVTTPNECIVNLAERVAALEENEAIRLSFEQATEKAEAGSAVVSHDAASRAVQDAADPVRRHNGCVDVLRRYIGERRAYGDEAMALVAENAKLRAELASLRTAAAPGDAARRWQGLSSDARDVATAEVLEAEEDARDDGREYAASALAIARAAIEELASAPVAEKGESDV